MIIPEHLEILFDQTLEHPERMRDERSATNFFRFLHGNSILIEWFFTCSKQLVTVTVRNNFVITIRAAAKTIEIFNIFISHQMIEC